MISKFNERMRGIVAASVVVLAAVAAPDMQAKEIFAELVDNPQVECTYVSGRFAHNQKTWRSQTGRHAFDLSRGFSSLYSYQCYSEESVKKARKILEAYLKATPSMEVVMRQSHGMQEYVVYEKFMADDKLEQMIIWNSDSPNVCEIVVIDWEKGLDRSSVTSYDNSVKFDMIQPDGAGDSLIFFSDGNSLVSLPDYLLMEEL